MDSSRSGKNAGTVSGGLGPGETVTRNARFADRAVLITGAAQGQGRSHAVAFAREGANVAICDFPRPAEKNGSSDGGLPATADLVRATGQRVLPVNCDVTDEDGVDTLISRVLSEFQRIDVLVANAGVLPPRRAAWKIPASEWDQAIAVNLTGTWLCNKAVLPSMITARSGKIINISSTGGLKGSSGFAGYAAAKWAVIGLTKTLAIEAAPYNINVNAVCPGPVATSMILNETFRSQVAGAETIEDLGRILQADMLLQQGLITPQAVTDAVLWLASDEARFVTGHVLAVDAGYVTK
jgi:(+)-trans-carveol dehydrogenase